MAADTSSRQCRDRHTLRTRCMTRGPPFRFTVPISAWLNCYTRLLTCSFHSNHQASLQPTLHTLTCTYDLTALTSNCGRFRGCTGDSHQALYSSTGRCARPLLPKQSSEMISVSTPHIPLSSPCCFCTLIYAIGLGLFLCLRIQCFRLFSRYNHFIPFPAFSTFVFLS